MNPRSLERFFRRRADAGDSMALCLVYATSGSTYSKAGDCMLIDAQGRYHGMLSGGCLEGDLAIRAAAVIETGKAATVSYDLANDDELWGLGVGCEGRIDVILIRLQARDGYEPLTSMLAVFEGQEAASMAVVIEGPEPGAAEIRSRSGATLYAGGSDLLDEGSAHGDRRVIGASTVVTLEYRPLPSIIILGAGPDVVPVLRFMHELGWRVIVADHRPAYIDNPLLADADERHTVTAGGIAAVIDGRHFDAALVMSHHLASDRDYLRALAASPVGYIGLLGPAARRNRLLRELGASAAALEGRLHGPAGLELGGRGAAAIALSLVAEIQAFLSRR